MRSRRSLLALLTTAAAAAAALPVLGIAAPAVVLPDLVADPPERTGLPPEPYTYPDGTRALLLRFDGYIHNAGLGVLEIRGSARSGAVMTSVRQYAQPAGGGELVPLEPASAARTPYVSYDSGDGHNHWHLRAAAYYSLWNGDRSAEVAKGQKVGFCLEDSERREAHGPSSAVYTDGAVRFCQQNNPTTSSVYMGTSAGWRDLYHRNLAYQWVDVSNLKPGDYWVAAEVDPDDVIQESSESNNTRAFARTKSVVPGYVAQNVNAGVVPADRASTVTLAASTFGTPGGRRFRITRLPANGTLSSGGATLAVGSTLSGPGVTYTPIAGRSGADSFEYAAYDSTSSFPRQAAPATATLSVGQEAATSVAISGAPPRLVAGTSVQLSASVSGGAPGVRWSLDGDDGARGTVSAEGLYTAPAAPPATPVVVRATSTSNPASSATASIAIDPVPVAQPAPLPVTPPVSTDGGPFAGSGGTGATGGTAAALSRPRVARSGRTIVVRVSARRAGTLSIAARRGALRADQCLTRLTRGRAVVCRMRVRPALATKPLRIVVTLKAADGTRTTRALIVRA